MFVAVRSAADLGSQASRILSNASTLLVHRSSTSLHFEPYVNLPWWSAHSFFDGALRQLPDDECFVIHRGEASRVHPDPVVLEASDVLHAHVSIPPAQGKAPAQPTWGETFPPLGAFAIPYGFEDPDAPDELDLFDGSDLSGIFGEEQQGKGPSDKRTPTAKAPPASQKSRHVRSKRAARKKVGQSPGDDSPVDF